MQDVSTIHTYESRYMVYIHLSCNKSIIIDTIRYRVLHIVKTKYCPVVVIYCTL